jgi:hypothetical protein
MKKISLLTVLLGLVAFSSAFADREGTVGVSGGAVSSVRLTSAGDDPDAFKTGYQAGAFGEHWINERFALGLGVDHVDLRVTDADTRRAHVVTRLVTRLALYAKVYAKNTPLMKTRKTVPYVVVGGGVYVMRRETEPNGSPPSLFTTVQEGKPGFCGGAGVDYEAGPQVTVGAFATMHGILAAEDYAPGATLYFSGGLSVGFGRIAR